MQVVLRTQFKTCSTRTFQRPHRHRHSFITTTTASTEDVAGLLVFSAIPFLAVQALADSPYGKQFLKKLNAQKPKLQAQKKATDAARAAARSRSRWFGPDRPRWLGPFSSPSPPWLNGTLPGDYGFDPLSLAEEEEKLDRYVELELLHARWAMLGALGALIPEALQLFLGDTTQIHFLEPVWWKVGAAKLATDEDLNYLGVAGLKVAGGQGVLIIAVCQVLLMFGPEYARLCGIEALEPLGIFLPGNENYPGGWLFDPLALSADAERFEVMRVREIKNGRLAMVAWAGFFVQGAATQKGPLENVVDVLHVISGGGISER